LKQEKNLLFLKKKKQKDFCPGAVPAALPAQENIPEHRYDRK
jgi:hypothetical protein